MLNAAYPRTTILDLSFVEMDHNKAEIAEVLRSHKSTISCELRRNCGMRGNRPKQAHFKALSVHNRGPAHILRVIWEMNEAKLRLDWSPEQIAVWLRKNPAHIPHFIQKNIILPFQIKNTRVVLSFSFTQLVKEKLAS